MVTTGTTKDGDIMDGMDDNNNQHKATEDVPRRDPHSDTEDSSAGSTDGRHSDFDDEDVEKLEAANDLDIFGKARQYLRPSFFFRWVISMYAQRKMVVFFFIHAMSTLVIWSHFAMIKFDQQMDAVPDTANKYWLKRLVPTIEFGSMHAILFQMALLPLTMCRYSIAAMSDSFLNAIVPLNRTLGMHIHLGIVMIAIVFFSTVLFFGFFGFMCVHEGEQQFCDKFTMEIMITGYCIIGTLLLVGVTSLLRHRIPYEVFYVVHHVVFAMYIITIAHTLDVEQRSGNSDRSQTFKWFSATILYYVCDRAAMRLNHQYTTKVVDSSVVRGSQGSKLVILKVRRPVLFNFKPGQYAYLRIGSIDHHWHPFSIASCPESSTLEFYIELVGEGKSWTNQLWKLLEGDRDAFEKPRTADFEVEVLGPYGTSLGKTRDFSHILAIGSGTGIVPIMSLYQQHIQSLLRLDPHNFFSEIVLAEKTAMDLEVAEEAKKGTIAQKLVSWASCRRIHPVSTSDGRRHNLSSSMRRSSKIRNSIIRHDSLRYPTQIQTNMMELTRAASRATRSIYGSTIESLLSVFGVTLFALVISWSTVSVDLQPIMMDILKYLTIAFQATFALCAIFFWNARGLLPYVDVVCAMVAPFADWYWLKVCDDHGKLPPADLLAYSILIWYMIARIWVKAVAPQHSTWYRATSHDHGATGVDKLNLVWLTRSASQVAEILPDILSLWDSLVEKWGTENASRVCSISVYVTDPDADACDVLCHQYKDTEFFQNGGIQFQRANLMTVVEGHTVDLINTRTSSRSLLAFCGSSTLAREIHYIKISNDMITAMTGNKNHQMEFVSESYGVNKSGRGPRNKSKDMTSKDDNESLLNVPTTSAYQFGNIITEEDVAVAGGSSENLSPHSIRRGGSVSSVHLWI
mmetsp:Transcript_12619/g.30552  ORF Transcript_12619/g.30552 Transcript_12619/m.30552 type:complete len:911 (-) Transcript_12619:238-2970(-)